MYATYVHCIQYIKESLKISSIMYRIWRYIFLIFLHFEIQYLL